MDYDYYGYGKKDVWNTNSYESARWPESFLYMHQCVSPNQQFAQSAEPIGYMRYDEVRQWAETSVGKRGADYEAFKEEHAQKMLHKLEQCFPGIMQHIDSYWTSSPLTYANYTNTYEGSMYGIVRDKNFPTQTLVSERTKVPNLFLTGQNINSHGILGVTIGAMITCAAFIGLNGIINESY